MLFVCSATLPPQTRTLHKNISRGDRKDANTAEGGQHRMLGKAVVKDSYLTGASKAVVNKAPRRKQRGINCGLIIRWLSAGLRPKGW